MDVVVSRGWCFLRVSRVVVGLLILMLRWLCLLAWQSLALSHRCWSQSFGRKFETRELLPSDAFKTSTANVPSCLEEIIEFYMELGRDSSRGQVQYHANRSGVN